MPSRWVIGVELADGEPVDARFLHAVVATWLDDVESHAKNDKGWAISPMRASAAGGAAFEVALIDDGLLARFETASSRPTIRVGSRTVKLVDPAEGQRATASCAIRMLRRRSLAELIREAQPAWKWEINFVTP